MAKKKKKSGSKGSGGGIPASPPVLAGIGILIAICVYWVFFSGPSIVMPSAPFTYMSKDGDTIEITHRVDQQQEMPIEKDGKYYWTPYKCLHPDCPGREGDTDYVFPHVMPVHLQIATGELVLEPPKVDYSAPKPDEETIREIERQQMEYEMLANNYGIEIHNIHCPKCEEAGIEKGPTEQVVNEETKKALEEAKKIMKDFADSQQE